MFNPSFYKYYNANPLTLNSELRDYIKKSNIDSFNKFAERNKKNSQNSQNSQNSKTKLQPSLINYRNYSATFLNNKISKDELKNEDYLCDFSDLSNEDGEDNHGVHDNNNINSYFKRNIIFLFSSFIGGTTIIGIIFFYYK
jgi:hypothetical protein